MLVFLQILSDRSFSNPRALHKTNEIKNSLIISLPATSVLSQMPSIRSVMNTAAVTRVAKKNTILQKRKENMSMRKFNRQLNWNYVIITPGAAYSWKSASNDE